MEFTIPDILPPSSGSPADVGVRTKRATGSTGSASGRKSFSSVLQGVREDGGRTDTRNADDARSTSKADQKTRSTDARERSASSTRSERTDGPSSLARDVETDRSGETKEGDTKVSETERIVSTGESSGGSDAQGRASESVSPVITAQAVAQAATQAEVRANEEDLSTTDAPALPAQHSQDPRLQAQVGLLTTGTDSPEATNSPQPTQASTKVPVLSDSGEQPQHDVPVQAPDTPMSGLKTGMAPDPVGKVSGSVTGEATKTDGTARPDMRPSLPDSQRPLTHSQPVDSTDAAPAPILAKAVLPGAMMESAKADSVVNGSIPLERMPSREVSRDEPVLREHQDTGGRAIPVASSGQGSSLQGDERFTGLFDDHQSHQHGQPETKTAQQTTVVALPVSGEQAAESALAGAQGRMGSSLPPSPPPSSTQSGGQVSPVVPTHTHAEQFVQGMTRSVVFNVVQPDLGQVNIRVAMTNEMVHTHLSADRPEVGQFLISGQDRLQAAFQASGLDMGQFRVDIDRQSAGRSFYQGTSSEQGQTWNQGGQQQGAKWEQGIDGQEVQRTALHGLLNVMA